MSYISKKAKEYILDSINWTDFDLKTEPETDEEKVEFLYKTFISEKGWHIEGVGMPTAFTDWIQGLPSALNIEFENYKILELAKEWGSLPVNPTEKEEDKILGNYWNLVMVNALQLFRKYKLID